MLLATSKTMLRGIFVCLGSLISSFTCNFFAYFKFHSDWGRVIGKIKQNEPVCRDTAPLMKLPKIIQSLFCLCFILPSCRAMQFLRNRLDSGIICTELANAKLLMRIYSAGRSILKCLMAKIQRKRALQLELGGSGVWFSPEARNLFSAFWC